jgi:hypothetical protein
LRVAVGRVVGRSVVRCSVVRCSVVRCSVVGRVARIRIGGRVSGVASVVAVIPGLILITSAAAEGQDEREAREKHDSVKWKSNAHEFSVSWYDRVAHLHMLRSTEDMKEADDPETGDAVA